MREIRLSGLEGGGAGNRSPYPYPNWGTGRSERGSCADFKFLTARDLISCTTRRGWKRGQKAECRMQNVERAAADGENKGLTIGAKCPICIGQ